MEDTWHAYLNKAEHISVTPGQVYTETLRSQSSIASSYTLIVENEDGLIRWREIMDIL